jgi:hypothetical protein
MGSRGVRTPQSPSANVLPGGKQFMSSESRFVKVDQHFIVAKGWKGLEKERAKRTFNEAVRENGSMDKVRISFNPLGQTHTIFCRIVKGVTIWAGIDLLGLVQFNDSSWVLNKGVEIADDMNLKEVEVGQRFALCELGQTLDLMGLAQCYLIGGVQEKKKRLLDNQNCVLMDLIQYTLSPRHNIKGLLPDAIACNSLSRRVVQPEKLIYSFRWLLLRFGDYGSQLGKQCDPYVLLIFKYFNYKDLVDEGETMAAKFKGVLDDFWKAALVEMYVEYGSVFWACENFYQFNRKSVGFAFYCEIIGWCERYEVCVSTFENLANRWARKCQPNKATCVLHLFPFSHNGHIENGLHVFRIIKDYMVLQRRPHVRDGRKLLRCDSSPYSQCQFQIVKASNDIKGLGHIHIKMQGVRRTFSNSEKLWVVYWNNFETLKMLGYMYAQFVQTNKCEGFIRKSTEIDVHNDTKTFLAKWNLSYSKVATTYVFYAIDALAVFELLVKIKQVHHLAIMLYYLNEGNFWVQHNGLFKLGGDHSSSLVELLALNLIICNCVTVRFNVKAPNERVVGVCHWMTSEKMSSDSARSTQK